MSNKFGSLLSLLDADLKEAIKDIHHNLNSTLLDHMKPNFVYSNGRVWFNYSAVPADLDMWNDFINNNVVTVERIMQTPSAFWSVYELYGGMHVPAEAEDISCDCGARKTYGEGAAHEFHATWCKLLTK